MANVGRYRERFPDVASAGKSEFDRTNTANGCFSTANEDGVPPIVARHLAYVHPQAGARTRYFNDPVVEQNSTFGKKAVGRDENSVGTLLAPPMKSKFRERVEDASFPSYTAPLSMTRNPKVRSQGPPVPEDTAFGILNTFESSTAECLHPPPETADDRTKSTIKVMYTTSHGSYAPAEQRSRDYRGNFKPTTRFGKPTPHSKEGKAFKQTMYWTFDEQAAKQTPLISRRARDFGDKFGGVEYQAPLGLPAEPLKDSRAPETFDPSYTYGSMPVEKTDSVNQLLHTHDPRDDDERLMQTRNPLRETAPFYNTTQISFAHMDELEQALVYKDVEINDVATGLLARPVVRQLLQQFGAPINLDDLPATGEQVQYERLVESLRSGAVRTSPVKDMDPSTDVPFAGHPTVRVDLPIQELKSVSDTTNYGDQGTVGIIMNPNNHTVRGLDEKDVLCPRPQSQIRQIFDAAGLGNSHSFDDVWARAQDAYGRVSVVSFQHALDQ